MNKSENTEESQYFHTMLLLNLEYLLFLGYDKIVTVKRNVSSSPLGGAATIDATSPGTFKMSNYFQNFKWCFHISVLIASLGYILNFSMIELICCLSI